MHMYAVSVQISTVVIYIYFFNNI